ncbi:MAG: hypothetical protein ACR2JG_12250 [Geodermatophilaceae bacterium]
MSSSRLPAPSVAATARDDALVEEQVAWDQPETRGSYAAYRLGALRWFAGGLGGVAVAIGLSGYAVLVLKRPGLGVFIVAALLLGLFGLVTGVGGLLRARRLRATLQRAPWRPAELQVAGAHLRLVFVPDKDATGGAAGNDVDANTVDARLSTTSRWRVRTVVGHRDSEVLVCPGKDGSYVLTAPGLHNLYGLEPLTGLSGRYRP